MAQCRAGRQIRLRGGGGVVKPFRVGVVGAGIFGVNHLNAFRQLSYSGVAELAAVAEVDKDRARWVEENYQVPVYADYKEMLEKEDLDAVTVATPDHHHRDVVVAAASMGKHVLCEKPLATTVQDCREMIDAANKANVLLQVDFHKRYDPEHIAVRERVTAGDFGKILYGSVYMEDRIEVPADWFPNWQPQSSPGWFLAPHFIDLVRWIMGGSNGKTVFARGHKEVLKKEHGLDTWDALSALVEFENGATITFEVSWILPREFEAIVNQEMRLVGTKGVWEIDSQDRGSRYCLRADGMHTQNSGFISEAVDKQGRTIFKGYGMEAIEDIIHNMIRLREGATIESLAGTYPSGEDGLEVTKIAAAIHESAETGKALEIGK